MKKRRFMGFLAMLSCATLLTGCDLPGPLQAAVDWANEKVVSPIKDLIPGSKKEDKKEDPEPVDEKFTVSFNAGEGSGSMAAVADVKGEYALPENGFTSPEGKGFAGWKVNGEGDLLKPGQKIDVSSNVSLVAQWSDVVITISEELPIIAFINDEINLDNYVSLQYADSFTVTLSQESSKVASLTGHTIRVRTEGLVSFTIEAGGQSAESYFFGMSEFRYAVAKTAYNFGNEYTAISIDQDGSADQFVYHGNGYVKVDTWDYDEESETYNPGGFLQFDGLDGVYTFTEFITEAEEEGGKDTVEISADSDIVYANMYMDYLNPSFEDSVDFLDFDAVKKTKVSGEEYLLITGEEAEAFAEGSLFAMNGQWYFGEQYGYGTCSKVYFSYTDISESMPDEFEEGSYVITANVYAYIESVGQEYYIADYLLTDLPAFVGDEYVEEFISNPENVFPGEDYAGKLGLGSFFNETIPLVRAFNVSYEYGWADSEGAFLDPESEEAQKFYATLEDYIVQDFPYYGKSGRIFAQNGILELDEKGSISSGVIQATKTIEEAEVNVVYDLELGDEGYEAYENSRLSDVYQSKLALSALGDAFNDKSLSFEEQVNYGTEESPLYGYVFDLNAYYGYEFFEGLLSSEKGMIKLLSEINYYLGYDIDMRGYFQYALTYVPGAGALMFTASLSWDEGHQYLVKFSVAYNQGQPEESVQALIDSLLAE